MTSENSGDTDSNLTDRFERGADVADEHGMTDPLLALELAEILDAVDAGPDTRAAAFDLAAMPAVEAHANGKSPTLVGAAIVYDSGMVAGADWRQVDIARAVDQSREAVSQHCRRLRAALDTDAPATVGDGS